MSVIHDALKTAQREKQARERGIQAGSNPLIAPPRAAKVGAAGARNTLTIVVAIVVIVAASWTLWVRMRNVFAKPMPTIPIASVPVEPPSSAPAAASSSARVPERSATEPARRLTEPPGVPAAIRVATAPVARPRVGAAPPVARRTEDAEPAAARQPAQAGGLRIAIERPRDADAALLLAEGVAAHRAGDLATARAAYERVLAIQPNDVDALSNLGIVLADARELERAEAVLRRAVRLAPRHTGAWNNLGAVLAQRGQATDAIAAYQHVLGLDPQHQGARVSMAQQHLAIAAPGKARELLDEVLAANPAMPEAHYTLGQALEMEKDWAGAIRSYSAFIRVAPPRLAAVVERVQQRVQLLSTRVR